MTGVQTCSSDLHINNNNIISSANDLEKRCYEVYNLTKGDVESWKIETTSRINNLLIVASKISQDIESFGEMDEDKKDLILMFFDYVENLLKNIFEGVNSGNMDQVLAGVLINTSERFLSRWAEIVSLSKGDNTNKDKQAEERLKSANKHFRFLNETCSQYSFFESVYA